jgi:hypothetical protein
VNATARRLHDRQHALVLLDGDGDTWGTWSSASQHRRYLVPVGARSRTRCRCGCRQRSTHLGAANGGVLISGCEMTVRRWVRAQRWQGGRA